MKLTRRALLSAAAGLPAAERLVGARFGQLDTQLVFDRAIPNPNGNFDELFVLYGDASEVEPLNVGVDFKTTPPAPRLRNGESRRLNIFHLNDLHHHLTDFSNERGETHKLSQMVKILRATKSQLSGGEGMMLLSAGDDHGGSIFDELLGKNINGFRRSAAYSAYSAAGFDASVIGSHDLERGSDILELAIQQDARFPVLSANLRGSQYLEPDDHPAACIGVVKGVRVGLIGLTTPTDVLRPSENDPHLTIDPVLATLDRLIPIVARYSDVIVVLSHVGWNGVVDGVVTDPLDVGDLQIAARIPELTTVPALVIGAHTHVVLNQDGFSEDTIINGVPVAQVGEFGGHLGKVTVDVGRVGVSPFFFSFFSNFSTAQYSAEVLRTKARDRRVRYWEPNYRDFEQFEDYDLVFEGVVMVPIIRELDAIRNEVIGQAGASQEITSAATLKDRYTGESAIANFMNDAVVARSADFPDTPDGSPQQADIAVFNASGIQAGVTRNKPITFGDWYQVMPFTDTIVLTTMTGQQIKDLLNDNARRIVRNDELLENGGTLNAESDIGRGYLHFSSAVKYEISPGADATAAVAANITIKGNPIDNVLTTQYTVAFTNYIVPVGSEGWRGNALGGGLPAGLTGLDLTALDSSDTGIVYRDEVIAYLRGTQGVIEANGAVRDGRVKVV